MLFLFVVMFFSLAACAKEQSMVLKIDDVQFLKVDETKDGLEMSGLVFHSSLGVKEIATEASGDELVVLVYLESASEKSQGNFKYSLHVPGSVNVVSFGAEHAPIWKRGAGVVRRVREK
ncbi:hypothetical protein [Lysobacter sp. CCNWLW3]